MKNICNTLLIVICFLLLASSCGLGRSRQQVLRLGGTEVVSDNISYKVINNCEENRFEVDFSVKNSADAWFSVSIGSEDPDVPKWNSSDDAVPPVLITDSNGMTIQFYDGVYRFNKSMTFYISYSDSPEKMKEFFSKNEGHRYLFTLDINDLQIGDGYYAPTKSNTDADT